MTLEYKHTLYNAGVSILLFMLTVTVYLSAFTADTLCALFFNDWWLSVIYIRSSEYYDTDSVNDKLLKFIPHVYYFK